MRRGVQLYIAGRQVDLSDDSWILFSWTREDMANPTSTVNSSSNQITLPGTCRNNALLGSVFRLDRRTIFGTSRRGVNFDPMRKTPFILYAEDGAVLESGYCRLDAVNTRDRRHEYTVTLYGGLGSFFYHLAMKEDGSARTLMDMTWQDADGNDIASFVTTPQAAAVSDAWNWLKTGEYDMYHVWNVVNFAPMYNGLPEDFDASHAISSHDAYFNVPLERNQVEGADYAYKTGLDCALLNFTNPPTEWEMCDLRWYLQRPVVSVKAFIAAICDQRNNGGYAVNLDPAFFNDANPAYADAWWTLPLISAQDRENAAFIETLLRASRTPMDYLTGYCKHFGLLFLWDSARHTVDIVTRATFYAEAQNDVIDLSARIDRSQQITQDPVLADKRWYQFGDGGKGAFVEQYLRDYGNGYAVQKVDTGYEFDAGTTVLTAGNAFKEAAEVLESSLMFTSTGVQVQTVGGWSWRNYLQLPRFEQVSVELWNASGESRTFDVQCPVTLTYYDDAERPGADWLPKVQAHGEDNKAQDGADILVFFAGVVDTPSYGSGASTIRKRYHLSNDSGAMLDLAGGPCWDLTFQWTILTSLPSFRRVETSGQYITDSWEWGVPRVRAVPGIIYTGDSPATLYDLWWKRYLRDRYATDTRVLTCMADLRGLPVGQALLRRFFWIDGALWTLNAIRNHPMTSWDLTECEFVKVGDKGAYTEGPGNWGEHYLVISPSSSSFQAEPGGGKLALTVRSSSAWTLASEGGGDWAAFGRDSGGAGISVLEVTYQANTGDARRTVTVTLTNADGATVTFTVSQAAGTAQGISLNPSLLEVAAEGTAPSGQADRGRSVRVTATGAWAIDTSTVPQWATVTAYAASEMINVKVSANESDDPRTASVRVYLTADPTVYATLAISQAAGGGGTGGITLKDGNGNTGATVPSAGQTLTLYVANTGGRSWTLTKTGNWGSLSRDSGTGDGSVTITVPATSEDREQILTATLEGKVQGAQFYLRQDAPTDTGGLTVGGLGGNWWTNSVNVGAGSGANGFSLMSTDSWTAVPGQSWVRPRSTWSGGAMSSYQNLYFDYDANSGAARVCEIVCKRYVNGVAVQTETFYVYQAGDSTRTLYASFNKSTIDASAQTLYLTVQASAGLAWTITSASPGLNPSTLSGIGTAEIAVDVSAASAARTLSLTVSNTTYGLSATASVNQGAPASTDYLRVTPNGTVNVGADDTQMTFTVESSTAWQVTTPASGVTVSPSSGTGNGTVTVTFGANSGTTPRSIALTFATTNGSGLTRTATIVQSAQDFLRITPSGTVNVGPTDTSLTFSVESSASWQVTTPASGVTISPSSGSGNGTVTVTFGTNTGATARSIALAFATTNGSGITKSATIVQAAPAVTTITVTPGSVELAGAGQSQYVDVTASGAWTASKSDSWIMLSASSGGAGTGFSVSIGAGRNVGAPRTGTVTFVCGGSTATVTVFQGSDATLAVSSNAVTLAKGQGVSGAVTVYASGPWEIWEYTDVPLWLEVIMPSHAGSAQGETVTFRSASANTYDTERSATIRLVLTDNPEIYQEIVVTQEGATYLYISPTQANPARNGGSGYFSVSCNTDWEVADMDEGVTIPAEYQEGTGDAQVPWSVDANPYSFQRMMSVGFATLNGERTSRVYLIQDGTELSVDTRVIPFVSDGGDATMVVLATSPWTVVSKPAWITVTPSSGAANNPTGETLVVTAAQNGGTAERTGTIVFGISGTDITAEVSVTQAAPTPQTLTISPTRVVLNSNRAYTGTLEIRCSGRWSIGNNVTPDGTITFTDMSGNGDLDVSFSVTANTTGAPRRLWANVTNQDGSIVRVFTVIQPA